MVSDANALWSAVDVITQPTRRKILRAPDADDGPPPWVRRLAGTTDVQVCDVTVYRTELRRAVAATRVHVEIPSLWDQAVDAVTTGSEQTEGGGASALRERSPADLDLMDIMLTIREVLGEFHRRPNTRITPPPAVPTELRALASSVIAHQPDNVQEWTARVAQWGRILAAHLQAADPGPRDVRLRNSRCPACQAAQVVLPTTDGPKVFPALLIHFYQGAIRAATCSGCGRSWWRGDQMLRLAQLLDEDADTPGLAVSAG